MPHPFKIPPPPKLAALRTDLPTDETLGDTRTPSVAMTGAMPRNWTIWLGEVRVPHLVFMRQSTGIVNAT
jgi:hypothetical protein